MRQARAVEAQLPATIRHQLGSHAIGRALHRSGIQRRHPAARRMHRLAALGIPVEAQLPGVTRNALQRIERRRQGRGLLAVVAAQRTAQPAQEALREVRLGALHHHHHRRVVDHHQRAALVRHHAHLVSAAQMAGDRSAVDPAQGAGQPAGAVPVAAGHPRDA
ncbi:hypothetical protein D3C78_1226500 [compost metagenome]